MKITDISLQAKNKDRVNVSVDGKYRFSLDVFQVGELGLKIGREYTEEELRDLETESDYGKLYARALEYCLMRPHSGREVRDYLRRKTLPKRYLKKPSPSRKHDAGTVKNEIIEKPGVSEEVTERVFRRLVEKGYIDDEKFARYWVENRNQTKGTSQRKLQAELRAKGVEPAVIEVALAETSRNDSEELAKVIVKKRNKYPDDQKLMQYLARQGFSYDAIKQALADEETLEG